MILGFGVLIFVHEAGHFIAAKWAGIRAEAFAIGMGPVALAWRKGIGLRAGSTVPEYHRRAHRELVERKTEPKGRTDKGEAVYTEEQLLAGADRLGLGETEYSLRWLPIGGFVKMLGQEDANPNKTSSDPRSYNMCPVGKRMIVVSAGVIMNLIFAAFLYVVAFTAGVQFEAPVIGAVSQSMPAGLAVARNAEELNVDDVGLRAGDRVLSIDGDTVHTFADIRIAAAMGRPDQALDFEVARDGVDRPLHFAITPKMNRASGLLGIGVAPASTTTLLKDISDVDVLDTAFRASVLPDAGVKPGMTMRTADGEAISTFQQFDEIVDRLDGRPVPTTWATVDETGSIVGKTISVDVPTTVELQVLYAPQRREDSVFDYEHGLFGMMPLTRIESIAEDSPNGDVLQPGDVVLRIGSKDGPQQGELRQMVKTHAGQTLEMDVLRDGEVRTVYPKVTSKGQIGVALTPALDVPVIARPFDRMRVRPEDDSSEMEVVDSPVAPLQLMPRTRIENVNGRTVHSWRAIREAMKDATRAALKAGEGAEVTMTVLLPTPDAQPERLTMALSARDVSELHGLGWTSNLDGMMFEPLFTVRSSGGNPVRAIAMGVEETNKTMLSVYLTIDRLVRGTVGVEQLRGPVGIVHIGIEVADKGFVFLLYLLAIISVNLAVINFLPLPIVDGGLFLFLIYEKLKGRPPSPKFQEFATYVGLFLIGTAILVVTWNDVMRLIQ